MIIFPRAHTICPQSSWNTTVCVSVTLSVSSPVTSFMGDFSLSHNCIMSQGCICFPLEPNTELGDPEASVIQTWVSLHLHQQQSDKVDPIQVPKANTTTCV